MARQLRIKGVRREQIDEDKLALAFLLLAKVLLEQRQAADSEAASTDPEAA